MRRTAAMDGYEFFKFIFNTYSKDLGDLFRITAIISVTCACRRHLERMTCSARVAVGVYRSEVNDVCVEGSRRHK